MAVVGSSPSSLFLSPLSFSSSPRRHLHLPQLHFCHRRLGSAINASDSSQETGVLLRRRRTSDLIDFIEEFEEESDDEEEDRSLDLFVRFVENVFRKVSRRARKAVRSVLPVAIPAKLVHFAVNGALVLTFMWILKAFLQKIQAINDQTVQEYMPSVSSKFPADLLLFCKDMVAACVCVSKCLKLSWLN